MEYLISAASTIMERDPEFTLVIAGKVKKGNEQYWRELQAKLRSSDRVIAHIFHIPDAEIELYFKAADVLVLPYAEIYQSGVPFLSYSFGLPVVATDVGSLREDVIEGETGFICGPRDPDSLVEALRRYFGSDLYRNLAVHRSSIVQFANDRYSWTRVAAITIAAYQRVLGAR
jgi:glycosyltransferase involved in cell wall biosynthesis